MKKFTFLLSGILFFAVKGADNQPNNLLDDWVMIPSSQTVQQTDQMAMQEYEGIQRAIRDQERAIELQNRPAWYKRAWAAFTDKLKAIPKGIGFAGDALRVLSRTSLYLDTTLRKILEKEEKKLPAAYQATFKQVRTQIKVIDARFRERIKKEADPIKDERLKQDALSAIQLEYLAALLFIARLDTLNPFGKISRDALILFLLTLLREIRVVKNQSEQPLSSEKSVLMPLVNVSAAIQDAVIKQLRVVTGHPLFVARDELVTNLVTEMLNQRTKKTPQGAVVLNPYQDRDAVVRSRTPGTINLDEKYKFLPKRLAYCAKSQQALFSTNVAAKQVPAVTQDTALRIGFVFSGGGYRAMTLAAGYLEALEHLKIDPLYISTLSGSAWLLAPWLLSGKSITAFSQDMANRIEQMNVQKLALTAPKMEQAIDTFHREIILPKFAFDQPIGTVDMYGGLLSNVLLGGSYTEYLSEQWQLIQDGSKPFPIYTTISMHALGADDAKQYRYSWYEVNPLECENINLGLAIPSWAFGRKFKRGLSQRVPGIPSYPYEQSLGFMLGTFGSAYTIDFLKEGQSFVKGVTASLLKTVQKVIRIRRLWPAQVPNPWKELPEFITKRLFKTMDDADWLRSKELLTFVDAGIDFNLPITPLLKKERALDVIIIGDASAGIEQRETVHGKKFPKEFAKFLQHIDPAGLTYEPHPEYTSAPFIVYMPKKKDAGLPLLVYVNFEKDTKLLQVALSPAGNPLLKQLVAQHKLDRFNPVECVESDYCNTFNFNYTRQEFEQLKAQGEFNLLANAQPLLDLLRQTYKAKVSAAVGVSGVAAPKEAAAYQHTAKNHDKSRYSSEPQALEVPPQKKPSPDQEYLEQQLAREQERLRLEDEQFALQHALRGLSIGLHELADTLNI